MCGSVSVPSKNYGISWDIKSTVRLVSGPFGPWVEFTHVFIQSVAETVSASGGNLSTGLSRLHGGMPRSGI
jgi:hypothetical protein